jgi:hypothetical protein
MGRVSDMGAAQRNGARADRSAPVPLSRPPPGEDQAMRREQDSEGGSANGVIEQPSEEGRGVEVSPDVRDGEMSGGNGRLKVSADVRDGKTGGGNERLEVPADVRDGETGGGSERLEEPNDKSSVKVEDEEEDIKSGFVSEIESHEFARSARLPLYSIHQYLLRHHPKPYTPWLWPEPERLYGPLNIAALLSQSWRILIWIAAFSPFSMLYESSGKILDSKLQLNLQIRMHV